MRRAINNAAQARLRARPNPWVGAVVVTSDGPVFDGATLEPGREHAEKVALSAAGDQAVGSTLYTTLEPCDHHGRTPPCTDAILSAGVATVVISVEDPDPNVSGTGIQRLREAGLELVVGTCGDDVRRQLRPYLTNRRLGRPHIVLKLAATLDGRIAAPDGSSTWITGSESRAAVHQLRAESDVIVVGSGTYRADAPSLTVRDYEPTDPELAQHVTDPTRFVVGHIDPHDRRDGFEFWEGDVMALVDSFDPKTTLQVMVEGGAGLAGAFHQAGLIDEYQWYVAPAVMGGDRGVPTLSGPGADMMSAIQRGRFDAVDRFGNDVRLVYLPDR